MGITQVMVQTGQEGHERGTSGVCLVMCEEGLLWGATAHKAWYRDLEEKQRFKPTFHHHRFVHGPKSQQFLTHCLCRVARRPEVTPAPPLLCAVIVPEIVGRPERSLC